MKVLVACEYSGVVRDAFRLKGHDAWSCDISPTESSSEYHYQQDVFEVIDMGWDLMVAHPPCTYLSRAGARWWKDPNRMILADEAAEFVFNLRDANIEKIAIENPIGQLNKRWRYPDQTVQPYEYGHPFSKATCLWLKNLPPLMPTNIVSEYVPLIRSNVTANKKNGRVQRGIMSGGIQTAKTFQGIADAMAEQWGIQ